MFSWACSIYTNCARPSYSGHNMQIANYDFFLFFLFFFLIRLERDYRLYGVQLCMIPGNIWSTTNCRHRRLLLRSMSHMNRDAAFVLHVYTTNFPHVHFEHSKQYKIPNSSFIFGRQRMFVSTVDGKIQSDLCKFLLLYDVLKYFFFNVILIIAGFATREDLFELIFGIFFPFYLRSPSPSFRLARYPWLWLLTTRFCRWLSPSYGHRSIQQHPGDDDDDASTIAAHYEKDVTMSKTKIG